MNINEETKEQADEPFEEKSTASQAYFNFLKSILGIGVIAIPSSSYQTGYIWAFFILLLILYCCYKSSVFLIDIADSLKVKGLLFNDLAQITLNDRWAILIDALIIINQVGVCIAYLIFLTQTIQFQFQNLDSQMPKYVAMLFTLIPILPLTFIQNMHFFHKWSTLGMIFACIGLLLAVSYGWLQIFLHDDPINYKEPIKIKNTFNFVGVGILAFEGIQTILPVRDSMINRTEFLSVFKKVMSTSFIIVVIVQQLCVLSYGDRIKPIVIFNIENHLWRLISLFFYTGSILLTYSLQLFPAFQIVEKYLKPQVYSKFVDDETKLIQKKNSDLWVSSISQIIVRLMTTVIIYMVVYIVPDFSSFLNILGSVFGGSLQYIFPCIMHMVYFKDQTERYEKFTYMIIISFATLAMIIGTWISVNDMI